MSKVSAILNKLTDRIVGIDAKFNSAIIVAGGSGTRAMTDGTTKQMKTVLGIPVVARTVSTFESCPFINEIIVVAKREEIPLYDSMQVTYGWKKLVAVVAGGETRQESVLNGFKKISDKSDFVYIHDAARCLVTESMIAAVGHAAVFHGAAIAAHKASDTVKTIEDKCSRPSTATVSGLLKRPRSL
jgi:2-C-methyl-D-erythritol 4-phosphate cytidylyltransferase